MLEEAKWLWQRKGRTNWKKERKEGCQKDNENDINYFLDGHSTLSAICGLDGIGWVYQIWDTYGSFHYGHPAEVRRAKILYFTMNESAWFNLRPCNAAAVWLIRAKLASLSCYLLSCHYLFSSPSLPLNIKRKVFFCTNWTELLQRKSAEREIGKERERDETFFLLFVWNSASNPD